MRTVARRFFLAALVLMTALVAFGHDAAARDTRAGFNVRVQVQGTGRAASISKSVASRAPPSGAPANQLRFGVTSGAGYFVRFEVEDPAVALVEIDGLGPQMRIASGARTVFVPSSPEARVVSYRVRVRPGAQLSVAPPVRATILP